jgi:hypothetical protein
MNTISCPMRRSEQGGDGKTSVCQLREVISLAVRLAQETRASKMSNSGRDRREEGHSGAAASSARTAAGHISGTAAAADVPET